jgi:hypothetical protein
VPPEDSAQDRAIDAHDEKRQTALDLDDQQRRRLEAIRLVLTIARRKNASTVVDWLERQEELESYFGD